LAKTYKYRPSFHVKISGLKFSSTQEFKNWQVESSLEPLRLG
jgi:hypothetical protein